MRAFSLLLEEVAENRDVPQDRHFVSRLAVFVLQQATNREGVAALDQDI